MPEQNGISIRVNRTLVETVWSMLADSRLPHKLWAKVLSSAAYLVNRSPTKSLDGKTPSKAWYEKRPNVNHLCVGVQFTFMLRKTRRNKLDPKVERCIFLSYGITREGYSLYDQQTSSIIYSHDIVFNESMRGHM